MAALRPLYDNPIRGFGPPMRRQVQETVFVELVGEEWRLVQTAQWKVNFEPSLRRLLKLEIFRADIERQVAPRCFGEYLGKNLLGARVRQQFLQHLQSL